MAVVIKGKCTGLYELGGRTIPCFCDQGSFTLNDKVTMDIAECARCFHLSADHESLPVSSPFKPETLGDGTRPRTDLCKRLFSLLQTRRVVHVRGTPTVGKSTLGRLFHNYVNDGYSEHKKMALYVDATGRDANKNKGRNLGVNAWLKEQVTEEAKRFLGGCPDIDAVSNLIVIIDEGQTSYNDYPFWNSLKDTGGQTHYMILCAWGSPTATPNQTYIASADLELPPSQRVGFSRNGESLSLLFTPDEHQDAIREWTLNKVPNYFHLSEQTIEYLYDLTNGHPGVTKAAFEILHERWMKNKPKKGDPRCQVVKADAFELFEDGEFVSERFNESHASNRGFPMPDKIYTITASYMKNISNYQTHIRERLLEIVACGQAVKPPGDLSPDPRSLALDALYRCELLQSELSSTGDVVYVFPSILHRRHYENCLSQKSPVFPWSKIPDLQSLLQICISLFSTAVIKDPSKQRPTLGPGAVARHLEAVYCDELYRCLFKSLGGSFVQSEWSGPNSNKRIDFRLKVAEDEGWGIECVRDETNWEEHISRALPGGAYALYIKEGHLTQYALVNFRQVQSNDATSRFGSESDYSWVYHVIFINDIGGLIVEIWNKGVKIHRSYCQA